MICTFFGHKDTPFDIKDKLKNTLVSLIEKQGAKVFYVGNQGNFDIIVRHILEELKNEYSHIDYTVVLAYMPTVKKDNDFLDYNKTIYPDILHNTPRKFAISKRNKWMIDKSNFVITYVKCNTGGAAKFESLAKKMNKMVINIAEL